MIERTPTPFDDALEDLRISGSVLLYETYLPPWAIDVPDEAFLKRLLDVGTATRVLPFHLVRRGAFHLSQEGHELARVEADEIAICPAGLAHRMALGAGAKPVLMTDVLQGRNPGRDPATVEDRSGGTELICGVFQMRSTPMNPMLAALPPVLTVKTTGADANPLLAHAAQMLGLEVANGRRGSFTALRLLEVFCAEAIRSYRERQGAARPGWFKALDDARIGPAIEQIHRRPGAPWTVAMLADTVAMSPSRFAARFRETTGESAMSYVASWRMNVACRALQESDDGLQEIAASVGYQDVAAFSRAFKEIVGDSPSRWRAGRRPS
ncbi:MAG: AraC family transcriptional regulator [Hyphomicrobiaceae bacterium]|nr:AraC family transcriptional regulator [Hyphomicrobiaceae bacterium]